MRLSAHSTILAVAALAALALPGGCSIDAEPDFDSAVPQERFLAIRDAKARGDDSAIPDLIRQLGTDDALVRVAAIDALEAITSETLGYRPHDAEVERRAAIDRWIIWLKSDKEAAQ